MHQQIFASLPAFVSVLISLLAGAVACAADRPPNILFILTDDQRFDTLGCMGNSVIKTPHIDRLAADGVVFDNTFCTTSICSISRASFMLGQYERRHRIDSFQKPYSPEQLSHSFPMRLRRHGYRIGLIGKWGIGGALPVDQDDYWRGYAGQGSYFPKGEQGTGQHLTDTMGAQALEFLDGCRPDQPWMLQLYTKAAHCQDGDPWPFQPAPRYNSHYADVTIPLPPTADEAHFALLPPFLQTSEARTRWHVRFENPDLAQKSLRDYYRLITHVDDWVGTLTETLRVKGFADNTVVIYTSDNGFYLADRGLAGKWFMHEESIRLPLVIHDPRLPSTARGTRRDEIALNIDIAPTILDLAGVPVPDEMQGASLAPLLRGEHPPWRDEFLYEHRINIRTIPQSEGVRTRRWKYVRYTESAPLVEQLFDLQQDPLEERDLSHDARHAAQLAALRQRWEELSRGAE
jgi:arylsulfatase A-like enzyme